jgi:hypothetical protein
MRFRFIEDRRAELAGGAELSYSKDAISFKSSVVGLAILFVSFAFFMVFVLDVYTLKETTTSNSSVPGILGPLLRPVEPSGPQIRKVIGWSPPTGHLPPRELRSQRLRSPNANL